MNLSSQVGQVLAVLSVGLLPVLLLAVLAAVEEGLAPAAPQGELPLGLLPAVHDTVCTNIFRERGKNASVGGHLHCRKALERNDFQQVVDEQGGVYHEERKSLDHEESCTARPTSEEEERALLVT